MTIFDYLVIAIFICSLVLSTWRGVVGEIIAILAWVLSFLAAQAWGGELGVRLYSGLRDPVMVLAAGWATIFFVVLVSMSLLRLLVRRFLKLVGLGLTDRFLGLAFGCVRAGLIIVLLVAIAGLTSLPREVWWQNATLARPLETAVLALRPYLPQQLAQKIHYR